MGSIDKALQALTLLAGEGQAGLPLAAVAERTGVHKTTAHRTLSALCYRRFVVQDPATGHYALGPAAAALGGRRNDHPKLVVLMGPALQALCNATGELVHLGVMEGGQVVYLDKVEPARPIRVWSAVGASRPAARTAMGRALLAACDPDEQVVRAYQAGAGDGSPFDLGRVLAATHRQGYATEREENEAGIACLGVPLWHHGSPVAAISVTAPVERMTPERVTELHRSLSDVVPPLLPVGYQVGF